MTNSQIDLLTVDLLFNFERIQEVLLENIVFIDNLIFRLFKLDISFDLMKISNFTISNCLISSFLALTSQKIRNLLIINSKFLNISIFDNKIFFLIASPGIYEITNSTFRNVKLIDPVKTSFIFDIENHAKFIFSGNQVLNCGSKIIRKRVFSNSLTSLDVEGLFLFWNTFYPIFIDFCSFKNLDGMTQNANGFIYGESNIQLKINNTNFEIANHNEEMFYKGLVFCKSKDLIIENSVFQGLRCHNLTKIYEKSTILIFHNFGQQIAKNFTANFTNNIFINCECKEFGVLSIFNYGYLSLNNNNFIGFNETGQKGKGAAVSIITSLQIEIKNTFLFNSLYFKSNCFLIETAKSLNLENTQIYNVDSFEFDGVISLNFILAVSIINLYAKKTNGNLIHILNTKCEMIGLNVVNAYTFNKGLIYFKSQESFFLKNASINLVNSFFFSLFYVDISYNLKFEDLIIETIFLFFNAAVFQIRYVENQAIFFNIRFLQIKGTLIILEANNDNATVSFQNISANLISGSFLRSFANVAINLENIFLTKVSFSIFWFDWYYEKYIVIQNLTVVNSYVESILQLFSLNFYLNHLNFTDIECKTSCFFFQQSNVTVTNVFIKLNKKYNNSNKAIFFTNKAFLQIIDLKVDHDISNSTKNYLMQFNKSVIHLADIFMRDIQNMESFLFRIIDSNIKYVLYFP